MSDCDRNFADDGNAVVGDENLSADSTRGILLGAANDSDAGSVLIEEAPGASARRVAFHDADSMASPMAEVEAIRRHPLFSACYARIELAERDRVFCRHQMPHLLDVARIAYIYVLERSLPFRKQVVYAAALLHDIGKAAQYEDGEPHEVAGARIAQEILLDIDGFNAREKTMIVAAVAQHRRLSDASTPLGRLLYEADKASRACYACPAWQDCNWPEERKNQGIAI